jgi:hypothetical protein
MDKINVLHKLGMSSLGWTERTSESEVRAKQIRDDGLVVLVPHIGIELLNNRLHHRVIHSECQGVLGGIILP